jgi:hypothetical protein
MPSEVGYLKRNLTTALQIFIGGGEHWQFVALSYGRAGARIII